MKWNWGKGIALAIAAFMGFILYFVIKVQSDSTYDNELVADDYYKQEIEFQQEIDKKQNTANLKEKVTVETSQEGIQITFPQGLKPEEIKGKISLYRPSNQKLDFERPISLSTSHLLIPKNDLVDGRWDISIDWSYQDQEYLDESTIYF